MINKLISKFNPKQLLFIVFACELINVFYYVSYLYQNHYLPAPFVIDKNDTLMDFYNPLFWVIKDSFYTAFNSVYPALNYYLLKIFALGISPDKVFNPFQLRNDYPVWGLIISFFYLLIIWVVVSIGEWKKIQFCNKALIFLACAISVPVLFALERGNLIFFALLFLALYLSASNIILRSFFLALLINTNHGRIPEKSLWISFVASISYVIFSLKYEISVLYVIITNVAIGFTFAMILQKLVLKKQLPEGYMPMIAMIAMVQTKGISILMFSLILIMITIFRKIPLKYFMSIMILSCIGILISDVSFPYLEL